MNSFTLVFLAVLAAGTALRVWLARRHIGHVRQHRDRVPPAFSDTIPLAAHRKAADYTVTKTRFGVFELLISVLLVLVWTLGGGIDLLDRAWRTLELAPVATGVGFLLSALIVASLLELPFSAYHTFVIEERFGFNRTTPALFAADTLKQLLLLLLLGTPLVWVVLWLMESAGRLWWVYAWAVWMAFSLFMVWAYPVFIAPLFNRFTPLENEHLKERIQDLLSRCGFVSKGIFVMDGSRRSGHGNAYFTGLGNNKRIVFFDTLIDTLEPEEVEAVLAHELGHFRLRHIVKGITLTAVFSLAGLALLGWLVDQPWFYAGLGVSTPSNHAALFLFLLAAPAFTIFLQPILAYWSRKHEFEADDYAAAQTAPNWLIRALVKLYQENAATLTPDPLYSAFHDSHPPAPVRVAHLSSKMAQQPSAARP